MSRPTFEEIYDQHYTDVWRYLLHSTGDTTTALELTAETFFRACRAWPSFQHEAPARVWLIRIAVNEWRRELRRRKIQRVFPFPKHWWRESGEIECDEGEVEAVNVEVERNESYRYLLRALDKLSERYREPLILRYFEHLSLEETAAILGRPVGTVKSLIHRGLAQLRADQGLRDATGELFLEAGQVTMENR